VNTNQQGTGDTTTHNAPNNKGGNKRKNLQKASGVQKNTLTRYFAPAGSNNPKLAKPGNLNLMLTAAPKAQKEETTDAPSRKSSPNLEGITPHYIKKARAKRQRSTHAINCQARHACRNNTIVTRPPNPTRDPLAGIQPRASVTNKLPHRGEPAQHQSNTRHSLISGTDGQKRTRPTDEHGRVGHQKQRKQHNTHSSSLDRATEDNKVETAQSNQRLTDMRISTLKELSTSQRTKKRKRRTTPTLVISPDSDSESESDAAHEALSADV
jgi:hypothetical protein